MVREGEGGGEGCLKGDLGWGEEGWRGEEDCILRHANISGMNSRGGRLSRCVFVCESVRERERCVCRLIHTHTHTHMHTYVCMKWL